LGRGRQGRRGEKELEYVQRIKHENKKLKRENAALRKQLARIDYTRFQNLAQLVEKQRRESLEEAKAKRLEQAKKDWLCHKCGKDFLRLIIWNHPVKGACYYRKCGYAPCQHRTAMKVYSPSIEGITEDGQLKESKDEADAGNESHG